MRFAWSGFTKPEQEGNPIGSRRSNNQWKFAAQWCFHKSIAWVFKNEQSVGKQASQCIPIFLDTVIDAHQSDGYGPSGKNIIY